MRGGGSGAIQPSAPGSSVSHGPRPQRRVCRPCSAAGRWTTSASPSSASTTAPPAAIPRDRRGARARTTAGSRRASEPRSARRPQAGRGRTHLRPRARRPARRRWRPVSLLPVDQVTQPGRGQGRVRERLRRTRSSQRSSKSEPQDSPTSARTERPRREAREPTTAVTAPSCLGLHSGRGAFEGDDALDRYGIGDRTEHFTCPSSSAVAPRAITPERTGLPWKKGKACARAVLVLAATGSWDSTFVALMRFRPRSLDERRARRRIARLLVAQGHWCATHDSPLYGSLLARGAEDAEAGGVVWSVLRARRHDAPESALALRLMGATQYLALSGAAPETCPLLRRRRVCVR